jgi:hypothetical protein
MEKQTPRYGKQQALNAVLPKLVKPHVHKQGLDASLVLAWPQLAPEWQGAVQPLSLRQGMLTLAVPNGSVAQQVQYTGQMVVTRVNAFYGFETVKKIVCRQQIIPAKNQNYGKNITKSGYDETYVTFNQLKDLRERLQPRSMD